VVAVVVRGGVAVVDGGGVSPWWDSDAAVLGVAAPVDARRSDPSAGLRLGALLRSEAISAGHESDWRAYVAGRLLLPREMVAPPGLLSEPIPGDADSAAETAERWQVDPDLLWLIVRTALDRAAAGRALPA
jgi:hypothetical protein